MSSSRLTRPVPLGLLLIALGGASLGGVSSCGRPATDERPNIILITIDTLRADRLGCYGYFRETSPELDRFAERAVLFENAYAPIATTLPSHVSLLTSTHPLRHGILANLHYFKQPFAGEGGIRTAAQMLSELGYETAAFVGAAPLRAVTGIAVGFDVFDEPENTERPAAETTDRVIDWLAEDRAKPFFLWVHYFDPHTVYDPPPPFNVLFQTEEGLLRFMVERRFAGASRPERNLRMQNLYDGEVRYADHHLGRLLRACETLELWDEAAIVVTADHGEGLGQHNEIAHSVIHNEQLRVPLLVKLPGLDAGEARREARLVALMDVLPTLMEELELPLTETDADQFEGRSFFAPEVRDVVFATREIREDRFGSARKFSLVGAEWKFSLTSDAPDELFHLSEDPHELTNVAGEHPDVAREYRERLAARIRHYETTSDSLVRQVVSPEHLEELRALGYVD